MPAVAPNDATPQQPAGTSNTSTPKTKKKNRCLKFLKSCAKDFSSGMAGNDYSDVGLGPSRADMAARKRTRVAKDARRRQGFSSVADCGL